MPEGEENKDRNIQTKKLNMLMAEKYQVWSKSPIIYLITLAKPEQDKYKVNHSVSHHDQTGKNEEKISKIQKEKWHILCSVLKIRMTADHIRNNWVHNIIQKITGKEKKDCPSIFNIQ